MVKPKEIAEISPALWYLPLERVEEVRELVQTLKQKYGYEGPVDDSDEWTEEDERDFTAASMKRLDEQDPCDEEAERA